MDVQHWVREFTQHKRLFKLTTERSLYFGSISSLMSATLTAFSSPSSSSVRKKVKTEAEPSTNCFSSADAGFSRQRDIIIIITGEMVV
jgi:hypothetical protein